MLRKPGSKYESGRSSTLLKVKQFHDAEAKVLGHQPGAGRHKGRLGALQVELPDGTKFSVGTGFSDAERNEPPAVGGLITFRYQELSEAGVPRFPSYVGLRAESADIAPPAKISKPAAERIAPTKAKKAQPDKATAKPRRFEFAEGASNKFWEISMNGVEVTVRYGRIGTGGQTKTKTFADETAATEYLEKLIEEKTEKGYEEVDTGEGEEN
jgi:DNA ligase-1